jgi:hypothetical protein
MYQKDYILRMIEMLGDLLRGIFGLITRGDLKQAEAKLNEAFYVTLRKDSWFFQNIPVSDLTKTLIEDHNYTNDHLLILAELLYAEAELQLARNKKAVGLLNYQKSLALFEFVDQAYRTYSEDRLVRMNEIRKKISDIEGEIM